MAAGSASESELGLGTGAGAGLTGGLGVKEALEKKERELSALRQENKSQRELLDEFNLLQQDMEKQILEMEAQLTKAEREKSNPTPPAESEGAVAAAVNAVRQQAEKRMRELSESMLKQARLLQDTQAKLQECQAAAVEVTKQKLQLESKCAALEAELAGLKAVPPATATATPAGLPGAGSSSVPAGNAPASNGGLKLQLELVAEDPVPGRCTKFTARSGGVVWAGMPCKNCGKPKKEHEDSARGERGEARSSNAAAAQAPGLETKRLPSLATALFSSPRGSSGCSLKEAGGDLAAMQDMVRVVEEHTARARAQDLTITHLETRVAELTATISDLKLAAAQKEGGDGTAAEAAKARAGAAEARAAEAERQAGELRLANEQLLTDLKEMREKAASLEECSEQVIEELQRELSEAKDSKRILEQSAEQVFEELNKEKEALERELEQLKATR